MQAAFEKNCFESHFNRNGYKFWKCVNHKTGCQAKIVSKDGLVYPLEREHNHERENIELIPTTDIVQSNQSKTPHDGNKIVVENVVVLNPSQSTSGGAKAVNAENRFDFKHKLNERFAAISQKLPIQNIQKKN